MYEIYFSVGFSDLCRICQGRFFLFIYVHIASKFKLKWQQNNICVAMGDMVSKKLKLLILKKFA